jgi:hypothetical protein
MIKVEAMRCKGGGTNGGDGHFRTIANYNATRINA